MNRVVIIAFGSNKSFATRRGGPSRSVGTERSSAEPAAFG
ncbi:hypothetical protein NJ7G_0234 [Natrinema sp. J7-2]|nr:hypothetical protein NJ7G_0234 [Natrinema sp. J7-2]